MRRNLRQGGFTLIELLAVVVIILILAGIVLGLVKFANEKAARAKAEGEMAAISTALESYKVDNGTYPKEPVAGDVKGATDLLDARKGTTPAADDYKKASAILYRALSGDPGGTGNVTYTKTYYNIPSTMMSSTTIPVGTTDSKYLVDPFGNSYGYSTANDYQASHATPPITTPEGFNPTYDLWSTAGYGPIKRYPSDIENDNSKKPDFWIKNW